MSEVICQRCSEIGILENPYNFCEECNELFNVEFQLDVQREAEYQNRINRIDSVDKQA